MSKSIKEEIEEILRDEENIKLKTLLGIISAIIILVIFFMPKIYIKNHIYYYSLDISRLYHQYIILQEENRNLKLKIEKLKFENNKIEP